MTGPVRVLGPSCLLWLSNKQLTREKHFWKLLNFLFRKTLAVFSKKALEYVWFGKIQFFKVLSCFDILESSFLFLVAFLRFLWLVLFQFLAKIAGVYKDLSAFPCISPLRFNCKRKRNIRGLCIFFAP